MSAKGIGTQLLAMWRGSDTQRYRSTAYEFLFIYSFSAIAILVNLFFAEAPLAYSAFLHVIPASCILALPGLIIGKYKKLWHAVLYAGFVVTGVIYVSHILLYGAVFDPESGTALLSTNSGEAMEYVQSFANANTSLVLLVFLVTPYFFFRRIAGSPFSANHGFVVFCVLVVLYVPVAAVRSFRTPLRPLFPVIVVNNILTARNELRVASSIKAGYNEPAVGMYPEEQSIIVVIGESANRSHMQLYGYTRPTSRYSELLDRLHVFSDVISPAPTTQKSLGMMLTFADLAGTPYTTTIFDIFKKAGFKTWWLSAQFGKQSVGSGIVPILAQRADVHWSGELERPDNERYDEYMLPKIEEALQEPAKRKLIIVQLIGSHTAYGARIPPNHRQDLFTGTPPSDSSSVVTKSKRSKDIYDVVNSYDDSILYTDFVVSRILETVDGSHGEVAVLYVSDHGEEVFDSEPRFGHAGSSTSPYVYEIPFVLRMSERYEDYLIHSGKIHIDTARPYQTDSLIHTLLNLAAIETSAYDPTKSILSKEFQERPRWIKGRRYQRSAGKKVKESPIR
jgi:heptose-I-phosphate ethanolaminephosphotransferase